MSNLISLKSRIFLLAIVASVLFSLPACAQTSGVPGLYYTFQESVLAFALYVLPTWIFTSFRKTKLKPKRALLMILAIGWVGIVGWYCLNIPEYIWRSTYQMSAFAREREIFTIIVGPFLIYSAWLFSRYISTVLSRNYGRLYPDRCKYTAYAVFALGIILIHIINSCLAPVYRGTSYFIEQERLRLERTDQPSK